MNLPRELEQIVEHMDEEKLHALLTLVRERLKFFHQMHDLRSLQQFHALDEVMFQHHGEDIAGIVIRINRRTVTVKTAERGEWKVSPVFLTKIREAPATPKRNDAPSYRDNRSADVPQITVGTNGDFAKVPRNALCTCGSGKKFKKCHGK